MKTYLNTIRTIGMLALVCTVSSYMLAQNSNVGLSYFYLADDQDQERFAVYIADDEGAERGLLQFRGANDMVKTLIGEGSVIDGQSAGFLRTFGANGEPNVLLGYESTNKNRGVIEVADETGDARVILGIDDEGGYVLSDQFFTFSATARSLRTLHPHSNGNDEIILSPLTGLEDAVFSRGTMQLVKGEAEVVFDELFAESINANAMTVMLSPLAIESQGLAVVEKTSTGFRVKELRGGSGSYAFDWEVKSTRKGKENYQKLQPKKNYQYKSRFSRQEVPDLRR